MKLGETIKPPNDDPDPEWARAFPRQAPTPWRDWHGHEWPPGFVLIMVGQTVHGLASRIGPSQPCAPFEDACKGGKIARSMDAVFSSPHARQQENITDIGIKSEVSVRKRLPKRRQPPTRGPGPKAMKSTVRAAAGSFVQDAETHVHGRRRGRQSSGLAQNSGPGSLLKWSGPRLQKPAATRTPANTSAALFSMTSCASPVPPTPGFSFT